MKKIYYLFFFGFLSSCNKIGRFFAPPLSWVPKHSYSLNTVGDKKPILDEKVPLDLFIAFDKAWNDKNGKDPMDEDDISFLIKHVKVEGGEGALFFRKVVDGKDQVGSPFVSGVRVKRGSTPLLYVPGKKQGSSPHKLTVAATILTCDFDREGGPPKLCSIELEEPEYSVACKTQSTTTYVEDGLTPFVLSISSDNVLAKEQSYRLVSWGVDNGKGALFIKTKGSAKPVYSGRPLSFGDNELFYIPEKGWDGIHTIHIEVGSGKGRVIQETTLCVTVADHRVCDFTASLSPDNPNIPLLPFKKSNWTLSINPVTRDNSISYKVKSIKMEGGKLMLNNRAVIDGTQLSIGSNAIVFVPKGHVGDLGIEIIVVNSKGDKRALTFGRNLVVVNPNFKVEPSVHDQNVNLKITSPHHHVGDKWVLSGIRITGGLEGRLVSPTGTHLGSGTNLQLGDNYCTFEVRNRAELLKKIKDAPQLYCQIIYPDGTKKEIDPIDLSYFLLEALQPEIADLKMESPKLWKTVVYNYKNCPKEALMRLANLKEKWDSQEHKIGEVLLYMQDGTTISPAANRAIQDLQELKDTTRNNMGIRIRVTEKFHDWYKVIEDIKPKEIPKERINITESLEKEVKDFQATWRARAHDPGMKDVDKELVKILADIAALVSETEQKSIAHEAKDKAYEELEETIGEEIEALQKRHDIIQVAINVLSSQIAGNTRWWKRNNRCELVVTAQGIKVYGGNQDTRVDLRDHIDSNLEKVQETREKEKKEKKKKK